MIIHWAQNRLLKIKKYIYKTYAIWIFIDAVIVDNKKSNIAGHASAIIFKWTKLIL